MKWYGTSITFSKPQPKISLKQISTGEICQNSVVRVRLYYCWGTLPDTEYDPQEPVLITMGDSGYESISETILLQRGKGNRTLFDENGMSEYFNPSKQLIEITTEKLEYIVHYQDYNLSAATPGNKQVIWYYPDGEGGYLASGTQSFTVLDCGCDSEHLDLCVSEATCTAAGGYWYDGTCHATLEPHCSLEHPELCLTQETCEAVSGLHWWSGACHTSTAPLVDKTIRIVDENGAGVNGASITIDGIYKGTTDSNGYLTVTGLAVGTHPILITATGMQDSDDDDIDNDFIEVTQ